MSYPSLRRFIVNRNWRRRSAVRMADTPPGEVAEADFGRLGMIGQAPVWAMIIVLGHSRHCFVWPMQQQKLPDVIAGLEAAWAFFGGMPKYLVIDNFPAAVVGGSPASHSHQGLPGVRPAPRLHPRPGAGPSSPGQAQSRTQGAHARERFFKGADFDDFTHVRAAAPKWCLEVAGMRIHGTTHKQPLVIFQDEERHTLLPWDGVPYEITNWRTNTVHQDFHIKCLDALYSVPSHLCRPGRKVEAGWTASWCASTTRPADQDPPSPAQGGRSTDVADYPPRAQSSGWAKPPQWPLRGRPSLVQDPQGHKPASGRPLHRPASGRRLSAGPGVDLIDVYRVERILIQALEEETTPQLPLPLPPGRFARPGCVFAQSDPYRRKSA